MAREAEGDAEKLAYLQKVIDALTPALQNAAKAAQEYADAVAAARKAGVYFGEYDTAAVLKAQTELVTKTRQEELEAARRNVEAQMQAQRTRGKYGFTEDVIARTAGGEETLYQNWFKARFGLTRSELDLANANWAMVEASQTRTKLLEMENEQMVKRTREAQSYQRSTEERIRSAYGITQAQTKGWNGSTTLTFMGLGVLLLLVFLVIESRSTHPLLPLRILKNRKALEDLVIEEIEAL